jgi:rhodanese-related sulfurtransferase
MTAEEVAKKLQDEPGMIVLDVRSRDEYESPTGHLKGARLIPVEELPSRLGELESLRSSTVVTYCHSGHRSHHAMMFLKKNGFQVINMSGGIIDWLRKGLPVVRE